MADPTDTLVDLKAEKWQVDLLTALTTIVDHRPGRPFMAVLSQKQDGTIVIAESWTTELLASIAGFDEHRPGKPWTIILTKDKYGMVNIIEGRPLIAKVNSVAVASTFPAKQD
jgi:hypothetical protein